jgi:hypothetical protein
MSLRDLAKSVRKVLANCAMETKDPAASPAAELNCLLHREAAALHV